METTVNESATYRLNPLLEGLAQAMRSTAQSAKKEAVDRCREDAKAYVERLQAPTGDYLGSFQRAAEADVVTLQQEAKVRLEQVRLETEARIARRRELLQQGLTELDSSLESQTQKVQERVAAFQAELARFCEGLYEETDPTIFANLASRMPNSPDFEREFDPQGSRIQPLPQPVDPWGGDEPYESALATAAAVVADQPVQAAPPPPVKPVRIPLLPGNLSGAGAVRGRLFSEWYGEVERLKEVGDEAGALQLLLDMVLGAEAESQAEGSPVASTPYEMLANMYRAREDRDAEVLLMERFARQTHGNNAGSVRLLERRAELKKGKR